MKAETTPHAIWIAHNLRMLLALLCRRAADVRPAAYAAGMNAPQPTPRDEHPELELLAGRSKRAPIVFELNHQRDDHSDDRETDRELSRR